MTTADVDRLIMVGLSVGIMVIIGAVLVTLAHLQDTCEVKAGPAPLLVRPRTPVVTAVQREGRCVMVLATSSPGR